MRSLGEDTLAGRLLGLGGRCRGGLPLGRGGIRDLSLLEEDSVTTAGNAGGRELTLAEDDTIAVFGLHDRFCLPC